MRFDLPRIRHDQISFDALTYLYAQTKECFFNDIEIDMRGTTWFDADMCAAFGAILYFLREKINDVSLTNVSAGVEEILAKNGFLSHYGYMQLPDSWGTTISYQRFDVKDERHFVGYVENEFMHRSEMPEMSPGLQKKFRESIFEIFSNAVIHSRTELGIFSCGQFFPAQNQLTFTVADLGIGIRQNIKNCLGFDLSPEKAIAWATAEQNTTKRSNVPGGLGLKLLCEFIGLNKGCIRIVSDAGYWQRMNNKITSENLRYPFPGTVVSVEINTADKHSYVLTSELSGEDIF